MPDAPLVVLTDGYTASASEIVVGALQDHDRGVIIGTTSFGKGLVQSLFTLEGGWGLEDDDGQVVYAERPVDSAASGSCSMMDVSSKSFRIRSRLTPFGRRVPSFKSDAGRVVYGGGGITPDVIVPSDTITDRGADVPQGARSEVAGELPRSLSHGAGAEGRCDVIVHGAADVARFRVRAPDESRRAAHPRASSTRPTSWSIAISSVASRPWRSATRRRSAARSRTTRSSSGRSTCCTAPASQRDLLAAATQPRPRSE